MQFAPDIIYNVMLLFIMMIPGVILKKCGLAPEGFGKGLSNLVLYIAQPALVFLAYFKDFDAEILLNSVYVLVFSLIAHAIFAVVALLLFKGAEDGKRRMLRFATVFSNAAFMGIPLIAAVLEDAYPGATLYASIYNISFNLFLWTLGVYLCTGGRDLDGNDVPDHIDHIKSGMSFKKALLHPVTIAAALGLVFFCFSLHTYVPTIITESLTMLKNLVAPLSMVVIGIRLADIDFHGFFSDVYVYVFLILRHIALPVAVVLMIKGLMLLGMPISDTVASVTVILAATPAASSATMLSEKFDCDAAYVSKLVALSTIVSILTMPLVIMLSNYII